MANSTAISAQNSTLQISTGTGGAKTITAAAIGFPTILTSAAHGLSNGDVVAIASITGTLGTDGTNGLNGKSFTVTNVTTNTFAVQVNSAGLAYTSGGTATPNTYTKIGNFKDYNGFDGKSSEIDVTHLESTAKEVRAGLMDNGSLSINVDRDTSDAGQQALLAAQVSGAVKNFKLTLPNAIVASFAGIVTQFSLSGKVDDVLKTPVSIRISGAVTWS